ncbi:MAG TPA: patatin-like phospholipase family protein, partial [Actinomycetota bacterium]|nr:patatin-like phospholipase family protein [Actinomycetota bacterium]
GGGPLGALQVGALRALFEYGITPHLAVGTSAGALNATFTAFDPTVEGIDKLETVWRGLKSSDLFPGGRFSVPWARMLRQGDRVYDNSGLRAIIDQGVKDRRIEDAAIPLGIVVTDMDTGLERVFTEGPIMDPLLASSAMPGVFPPVVIDGRSYIDGGVSNNVPIGPAVSLGATTVYVMDSTGANTQRRPLNRPLDYLLHAFALARSQRLAVEQALYAERVRLVILPTSQMDFYVPFASMEHTDRLIGLGYRSTVAFLEARGDHSSEPRVVGDLEVIAPPK